MTARGMVRSGSRASDPKVVALSKPTKLKMASITASPTPRGCSRAQVKLRGVQMEAVAKERQRDDDGDQDDGDGFNVEHHPRGDLHVAIRRIDTGGGGERGQRHRRKEMRPSAQEDLREVDEAANNRRCRGDVGKEERPSGQRGEDWWQRDARVDVERAGRGGLAREVRRRRRRPAPSGPWRSGRPAPCPVRRARRPAGRSASAWCWERWWRPTGRASRGARVRCGAARRSRRRGSWRLREVRCPWVASESGGAGKRQTRRPQSTRRFAEEATLNDGCIQHTVAAEGNQGRIHRPLADGWPGTRYP